MLPTDNAAHHAAPSLRPFLSPSCRQGSEQNTANSANAAPQSQAPPIFAAPLPSVEAEAVFALHYALFICAKTCVQLATAVAVAASSSQAWHLDFRIGRSEGVFCPLFV